MANKKPKQNKPKTGLARCLELASNKKGLVFLSAILSSLAAIASFVPYIAVYFIISSILKVYPNLELLDMSKVMNYGWIALAGIIANILLYFLAIFSSHMAAFGTLYELKLHFAEHITKIPLGYHLTIGSGRLRKIMDENIESIEGFIAHQFPDFVASVTAPIVMVIILLAIDWRFGIASLVGIVLAFVVQFSGFGSGAMKENMGKYQIALEDMNNASVEYVRGMPVVKAFNQTASSFARLEHAIKEYTEWVLKFSLGWQNYMPAFTTIINNIYLVIVPVGILLGANAQDYKSFTMTFIFYLLFVPAIAGILNKIMYISESFMQIDGNVARMDEIFNIPVLPQTTSPKKTQKDDVVFDNVSFTYTGKKEEMSDCSSMESMLSSTIPPLIANGITVTLTCILLAFFDWRLALCMYITLPVAFLIIWLSKNYQKKLFERQVQAKLDASSQVQEYLEGMKIIKSCNLSGSHFSALNKALLSMKKIAVKVEMICGVFMSSASMILQAGIGIVIFVGTMLLVKGEIELLPLLMFFLMVTRIYGPILAILSQLTTLLNLNVVTERMRTLLSTSVMQGNDKEIENCDIELEHVTFRYNTKDVIKDVTCKIPQGSITALVGSSGSGKSTISKLIARFWDIQKGTIRVGGKDIRTMEPESLMRKMAFVFQDVTLFNDTVFNNISIGNPNATEEEVMAAAKAAYCDEFVRNMPDGYQTVLGENGSTLSGGERQRISIARALLKNASIIFLDEATASLDPENEVLVQKAIAQLVENKTVIMIAHRLRTVVDADQILVLDDGKLVEYGTHNELMKKKGVYQKLYHIQQESLGWTI